jgi:hypothetical protein
MNNSLKMIFIKNIIKIELGFKFSVNPDDKLSNTTTL